MRGISLGLTVRIHEDPHARCCMAIELLGLAKKNFSEAPSGKVYNLYAIFSIVCITYCAPLQPGWTETARSGSLKQWQRDRNFPEDETFSQSDPPLGWCAAQKIMAAQIPHPDFPLPPGSAYSAISLELSSCSIHSKTWQVS